MQINTALLQYSRKKRGADTLRLWKIFCGSTTSPAISSPAPAGSMSAMYANSAADTSNASGPSTDGQYIYLPGITAASDRPTRFVLYETVRQP